MRTPSTIGLFLLCIWCISGKECIPSHFQFVGFQTLRQNELTLTLSKVQEKVQILPNITFKVSQTLSYTIFNAKPIFLVDDSKTQMEVYDKFMIKISQGIGAKISFEWVSNSPRIVRSGSGKAFGRSNNFYYVNQLRYKSQGKLYFEYADSVDVQWKKPFQVTDIEGKMVSNQDREIIYQMFNEKTNSVQIILQEQVGKYFDNYLSSFIEEIPIPIGGNFNYKWVPGNGKPNITISYSKRIVSFYLNFYGDIGADIDVQATNSIFPWKCPSRKYDFAPLNIQKYGGKQEFVLYEFYQSVIIDAADNGLLDTDLTLKNWGSKMFQFVAGDLYAVLGNVKNQFEASEAVNGRCKAVYSDLKVAREGPNALKVTISFGCDIEIQRVRLLDFSVGLEMKVEVSVLASMINYKLRDYEDNVSFYPRGAYTLLNEGLARAMVKDSLKSHIYEGNLFGSGWPLTSPHGLPGFIIGDQLLAIYDNANLSGS